LDNQSSTTPRARRLPPRLAPAALALLLGGCAGGTAPAPQPTSPAPAPAPVAVAPALPSDTLREPFTVRTGRNGVLDATLAATWALLPVPGHSQPLPLRTYRLLAANGVSYADSGVVGFPGPTFRVSPGDSVALLLLNRLVRDNDSQNPPGGNEECVDYPAADSIDAMPDCFHGSEWTNIHYHGFHVTPDSLGDDVLLQIAPGDTFRYAFRIPQNQSPGTHWYHPHKHGSVALQVMNGMSGAFVVQGGGLDELTRRHGIRERLLALQQVDTTVNLLRPAGSPTSVPPTLVNGQLTPLIVMQPGEVQRWRIVNENVTKSNQFRISFADSAGQEPTVYDIARDGVQYAPANYSRPGGRPAPDTSVLMAPGNRLDVFVQAPANKGVFAVQATQVGHLTLLDRTRKPRRAGGGGGGRGGGAQTAAVAAAPQPLFYVQVADGPDSPTTLPDALPPLPGFLANLPGPMDPDSMDAATMPVVVFADSAFGSQTQTDPTRFFIGTARDPYQKFGPDVYVPASARGTPLPMRLDSVQTWKVVNQSLSTNHPFHIHINPFQVIHVEYPQGAADPNALLYAELNAAAAANRAPVWMDVVALPLPDATDPVGKPGYVIIRQRYADFTGQYVMHCHILGHEERGMMQLLEVRDGASPARPIPVRKEGGGHRH
jgi:FtsP/CotA-like multicopper oxidase with cupredoxin domain